MNANELGKIKKYILQDRSEPSQEIEESIPGLTIWADPGYAQILRATPGVHHVYVQGETNYYVDLDPRYDREKVKDRIRELLDPTAAVRDRLEKFQKVFETLKTEE